MTAPMGRHIPGNLGPKDPDNRWGIKGQIDCPICKSYQALRWARSSVNGHVRFSCSTPNCVSGIQ